jgi:hypothetical protein
MNPIASFRRRFAFILVVVFLGSCAGVSIEQDSPLQIESTQPLAAPRPQLTPAHDLAKYEYPSSIDPEDQYLFYLHGKIIEDQGIPAVSPEFGKYEYQAILEQLSGYGFVVISEGRTRDTDGVAYARKISDQITTLIEAGVPAKNIIVVGASKGGAIAIFVSHFLENEEVNIVLMGICHPDYVEDLIRDKIFLYGNILSIYDFVDEFAGSCQELFSLSEGRGLSKSNEIVLDIGTGHGILYQPLDDWILPVVQWANNDSK